MSPNAGEATQLPKKAVLERLRARRRSLATMLYASIVAASYCSAFLFRFNFQIPKHELTVLGISLVPLVAARLLVFHAFRLTRERWRYVGIRDIARLAAAIVNGSAIIFIGNIAAPRGWHVPLSILALEAILTCWLTAAVWVLYRIRFEHGMKRRQDASNDRRVLVVGAGEAGNMLVREMLRFPTGYIPVGFVDDDPNMWGASVQGIEVIGASFDLPSIAESTQAQEIIIAIPSAGPTTLRQVVNACELTSLPFKVLPGIREVLSGNVSLKQLRDVRIEDLLGREPVELELPELSADLAGTAVLITGAAGSIGSELARQVALHDPSVLILFDQAETELFYLEIDLKDSFPAVHIIPVIGDIVDGPTVERLFTKYAPDRVFHAAAYKHVPMMQVNPAEAVRNNVLGTWRVADAAGRHRTKKFILVSTDKAVRPANVMGATKRLAELTVMELQDRHPATSFGAVRFGNVLGSNGSVLPVFKRQLQAGRPLTVTHSETTRYFMTIPEAVQLILQASLLEELRGHIAMLDMGEPIRITDLAVNLLRLSGVSDPRKHIVFTGLRSGEKMHEELAAPDEEAHATAVPKVHILKAESGQLRRVVSIVESWAKTFQHDLHQEHVHSLLDIFPGLGSDARSGSSFPEASGGDSRRAFHVPAGVAHRG